jgi:hypothetical protein
MHMSTPLCVYAKALASTYSVGLLASAAGGTSSETKPPVSPIAPIASASDEVAVELEALALRFILGERVFQRAV